MVIIEKSFPRGGVAQAIAANADKSETIVFGATQFKKKTESKKANKSAVEEYNEEDDRIEIASAGLVNYHTLQDGMIILGIVKSVDDICIKISLPGRIIVKVFALSISNAYTKNVSEFVNNPDDVEHYKQLSEMYKVGQLVYGKVMEIKEQENGHSEVEFSLKPSDVHSELVHTNIKKGFVFNGAIEEVQEHGYIIETGIKNLRCFLPIEKSNSGHAIGESVFMKVEDLKQQSSASTIRCKELNENSLKIKDKIDLNLDYLLPSTIVNFTVTKHLKDGLQGTLMNGAFTAYVNEHNLQNALGSITDVELNSTLSARILYVAPLTKFVFLSLNLYGSQEQSEVFQRGEIVEGAAVHHIGSGGIVVVLKNKHKGLISLKSIKANHTGNFDMDQMLNKYTKKSKHTVRVLDYDFIGGFFVCTDDPNSVNEKIFSTNDILTGDIVKATVIRKEKNIGGYAMQVGRVNGVIESLFLSPTSSSLTEKSKVKCRVVAMKDDRNFVYLTNLNEYLAKDCKILASLADAKVNSVFLGTIVKCESKFAVVKFFNDIKGIFYLSNLNDTATFFEGQTMHFRILSRSEDNITLGLPEDSFELGEFCRAKVTHVLETGLEIQIESKQEDGPSIKALVPDHMLSDFPDLNAVKLGTYSIGQEITACCISKNLFSIRDVPNFVEGAIEWKRVQVGDIMRAFVKDVQGDVIDIVVPIKGFNKIVKLHTEMALLKAIEPGSVIMIPEQVIYVEILSKDIITKSIGVSAKLSDVWNGDFYQTGEYFGTYLKDIREIKKSLKKQNHAIAQFEVGEKIVAEYQGTDADTDDWLLEVDKKKVLGLIKKSSIGNQKPPNKGTAVECIVLWVDYLKNILYLSNNKNDISRIVKSRKLPENLVDKSGINAKVLLKLDNTLVCSLKKAQNPLAYIPTRLHYNDFNGNSTKFIKEGDFCKLSFVHKTLPIAILEETKKLWQDNAKLKRKLEQKIIEGPVIKKMKKEKQSPSQEEPLFYDDRIPSISAPKTLAKKRVLEQPPETLQQAKKKVLATTDKVKKPNSTETIAGANTGKSTLEKTKALAKTDKEKKPTSKETVPGTKALKQSEKPLQQEKKNVQANTDKEKKPTSTETIAGASTGKSTLEKPQQEKKKALSTTEKKPTSKETVPGTKASKQSEKPLQQEKKKAPANTDKEKKPTSTEPIAGANTGKSTLEKPQQEKKKAAPKTDKEKKPTSKETVPVASTIKPTIEKLKTTVKEKNKTLEEALPGVANFWSTDLNSLTVNKEQDSSSDDDEEPCEESQVKKKKKQSASEKFKAARKEEARLREIEERYANPDILPETTDQFDRLVLSAPNDSKNWINYMVFHLQAMEIDKARAVSRRALKAISFRESEDLLNIWVALLNLELRYGTKENFNDVLKESLMNNDQLKIYMRVLEILAEANKTQELIELVGTVTKKFKDNLQMWKCSAIALYKVGIHDRAQQMMHKALAVLPEREHVNTIVAFANLTHKYSKKPETAHALLDQVVTSYPKRVDVWSQFVDMLIKDDQIESARRTLERAVIQKLPLKKMRILFKKYLEFEELHGTPENIEKVKSQAAEYVKNNS